MIVEKIDLIDMKTSSLADTTNDRIEIRSPQCLNCKPRREKIPLRTCNEIVNFLVRPSSMNYHINLLPKSVHHCGHLTKAPQCGISPPTGRPLPDGNSSQIKCPDTHKIRHPGEDRSSLSNCHRNPGLRRDDENGESRSVEIWILSEFLG